MTDALSKIGRRFIGHAWKFARFSILAFLALAVWGLIYAAIEGRKDDLSLLLSFDGWLGLLVVVVLFGLPCSLLYAAVLCWFFDPEEDTEAT